MIMKKECKICKQTKDVNDFSQAKSTKDGYNNHCKKCICARNKLYWKTTEGRLSRIYTTQNENSKNRGHLVPSYSKKEFIDWALNNGMQSLMKAWEDSGFTKDLIPSVDRLDASSGYSLTNIRLVTWKDNNDKAYEDRKSCKHITKQNRRVEQLSVDGKHIAYYESIASAARATGAVRTNINAMCSGNSSHKVIANSMWRYA